MCCLTTVPVIKMYMHLVNSFKHICNAKCRHSLSELCINLYTKSSSSFVCVVCVRDVGCLHRTDIRYLLVQLLVLCVYQDGRFSNTWHCSFRNINEKQIIVLYN